MGWDGIMRSWHEREEGDGGELKRMEGARVGKGGGGGRRGRDLLRGSSSS